MQTPVNSFHIISTNGNGDGNLSKTAQEIMPSRSLGQANVNCSVNAVNGNLFVEDKVISMPEPGNNLEFGYVYNAQSEQPWHFSACKSLSKNEKNEITLIESDGHESIFIYDEKTAKYRSKSDYNGLAIIQYDQDTKCYQSYNPKQNLTEIYDYDGRIKEKVDLAGNKTTYAYQSNGDIKTITGPSGNIYLFDIKEDSAGTKQINIYLSGPSLTLLHSYTFQNGSLKQSTCPHGYCINYQYDEDKQLNKITQSDTTEINFTYKDRRVDSIITGEGTNNISTFLYDDKCSVTDACGNKLNIRTDSAGNFRSIENGIDSLIYSFNELNQIEEILYLDGSTEIFSYDEVTGLLKQYTERNGAVTNYEYKMNALQKPILQAEHVVVNGKDYITQYIYENEDSAYPQL